MVLLWVLWLYIVLLFGTSADFEPRFKQYELDSSRNESGRYRAQTHADKWYICHYLGPGDKIEVVRNYVSPQCMQQNKDALDKEEKADKKFPYFFPNIGVAAGCLVPKNFRNLSDGEWICQGDIDEYTAAGIVPVYHSCWLLCNENYTLSVPLRDFRCTEKRIWDGNLSGILCQRNATFHNDPPITRNELLEDEMHYAFIAGGCVVLLIIIALVSCQLYKLYKQRSEDAQNESSRQHLLVPIPDHVSSTDPVQDSSYGSVTGSNEENNGTEDEVREDGNKLETEIQLEVNLNYPPSYSSGDSGVSDPLETDIIKNDASVWEDMNKQQDCKAELVKGKDPQCTCRLTVSAMIEDTSYDSLYKVLGYMLDPTDESGDHKTWKGFARNVLTIPDFEIKTREHHYKGNHNDGYFSHLLDDMKARGTLVGDIVNYFSRKENLRKDVLEKIAESHKGCEFCTKYFEFHECYKL